MPPRASEWSLQAGQTGAYRAERKGAVDSSHLVVSQDKLAGTRDLLDVGHLGRLGDCEHAGPRTRNCNATWRSVALWSRAMAGKTGWPEGKLPCPKGL